MYVSVYITGERGGVGGGDGGGGGGGGEGLTLLSVPSHAIELDDIAGFDA